MIEETNHKYIKGMGRNITKTSHWGNDVVENSSPEILRPSVEGLSNDGGWEILRPSVEGLAMTGGGRFFTVSSLSLHFVQGFGSELRLRMAGGYDEK